MVLICITGFAGTPGYLSPEVLEKDPYYHPVDIWGCGESHDLYVYICISYNISKSVLPDIYALA